MRCGPSPSFHALGWGGKVIEVIVNLVITVTLSNKGRPRRRAGVLGKRRRE
jgi:hypothetical protein